MNQANRLKNVEREARRARRQEREDAAGKLLRRVPNLATLSLAISEARPDGCASDNQYIRRIVVEHAPALFEIPCSYEYCEDGGYDATREILAALGARQERFEGEIACRGRCKVEDCARILRYVGTATYRPIAADVGPGRIVG